MLSRHLSLLLRASQQRTRTSRLLPLCLLLRPRIYRISWLALTAEWTHRHRPDGSLVWRLALASDDYIHHHDVQKLANGNLLAASWERVSTDEAIALGRKPEHFAENGDFWFDGFVEVNLLTAEIVWEWSIKNHLIQDFDPNMSNYGVVADNPGKLDSNAIDFNRDGSVDPEQQYSGQPWGRLQVARGHSRWRYSLGIPI